MTSMKEVPLPDKLTEGGVRAGNVRDQLIDVHPLEKTEKLKQTGLEVETMDTLAATFGLHAPLRLALDVKQFSKPTRLGGLPSSRALLNSITGADESIDFHDVLNPVEFRERQVDPHLAFAKLK